MPEPASQPLVQLVPVQLEPAEQTAGRTVVVAEQETVDFAVVVVASWSSCWWPVQTADSDSLGEVEEEEELYPLGEEVELYRLEEEVEL